MLAKLYKIYIPKKSRDILYNFFLGKLLFYYRRSKIKTKAIYIRIFRNFLPDTLENNAYCFIAKYGITDYPFLSSLKYKKLSIQIFPDKKWDLPYVLHKGNKLYFPREFSNPQIENLYRSLLIEQDSMSPHRYVKSYQELTNKILLDIGAAEGIFSLDTIQYTKKVFLFEYEKYWQEALQATFNPWKDKVTIIPQYICDINDNDSLTLDNFFLEKDYDNIFIKMDIEGAELSALKGAEEILKCRSDISLSICTYHKPCDPDLISKYFHTLGYKYEFTEGSLFFMKQVRSPVLLRAWK